MRENEKDYSRTMDLLFHLLSCVANDRTPDASLLADADLDALYKAALMNMVAASTCYALEKAGIRHEDFELKKAKALRLTALMEVEWNVVSAALDKAGIWYVPLKGAVLKDLYPEYGIREMSDYDIYFDAGKSNECKAVMESLGYHSDDFDDSYHDTYIKEPLYKFEMHRTLFGDFFEEQIYTYFLTMRDRLLPDGEGTCRMRMTPEDTYLFLIAHSYKHYDYGSYGLLKNLLDIYIYLEKVRPDLGIIREETDKLGITSYDDNIRALAYSLFGDGDRADVDPAILERFFDDIAPVEKDMLARSEIRKLGKLGYFKKRFFLPERNLEQYHPIVYKYKILRFPYAVFRVVRGVLFRRGKFMGEIKELQRKDD